MDAFVIKGGKRLRGRVRVHGSKNSSLPLMSAALLTDEPVVLRDVPDLSDIANMAALLGKLGCPVERRTDGDRSSLHLHVTDTAPVLAHYDIVRTMRASICVLGPLLAKRGKARVSMPGGCNIGDRPVDLHIRGLRALGAQITLDEGYIVAATPPGGRLRGARVFLGGPFGSTVLGTDNVMCAAALAEGTTIIESAACEPEVADMADLLNGMGARITGAGSPRIVVEGVEKLHGVEHTVIPDRIEAGTYLVAAAITNGDVVLENCPTDALTAMLDRLEEVGVEVEAVEEKAEGGRRKAEVGSGEVQKDNAARKTPVSGGLQPSACSLQSVGDRMRQTVRVASTRRLNPVQVVTQPHPGFPTDLQAQIMALLCLADGNSIITEKIFPDRFLHVAELLRMGANCIRNGPSVMVSGVHKLIGAPVMASDLRASAGLVLAGLAATGTTTVNRVYHLDRGYERMELTLQALGASIGRVNVKAV
jgi:UDP-N-acetylglucosamine 1-carboxyvinyltransferase